MLDLVLTIVHHLLVFGLAVMLAMELAWLRADPVPIARLSRIDAGYGGVAALIVVIGVARVIWGAKGWVAYQDNPFFWAKIATFVVIGLLSIAPTLQFVRWSRALRADARPPSSAGPNSRTASVISSDNMASSSIGCGREGGERGFVVRFPQNKGTQRERDRGEREVCGEEGGQTGAN